MAEDRINVRLPQETIKFLEQVGHDPDKVKGARSRGVAAVIAFAQHTPRAFKAFLNGHEFADIGEIITVREEDCCVFPDRCTALRVAAEALDIAADWNIDRLDIETPPGWEMGSGFCNTRALAQKLREIAGGVQCNNSEI